MTRPFPLLLCGLICVALAGILELPGTLWGLFLKSVLGLWVLVLLKVAANRMILPGIALAALFFGLTWWFAPSPLMYLFGLLMFGALFLTYRTVELYFGGFREKE